MATEKEGPTEVGTIAFSNFVAPVWICPVHGEVKANFMIQFMGDGPKPLEYHNFCGPCFVAALDKIGVSRVTRKE